MDTLIKKNELIAQFMGLTQGRPNEIRWKHDWFDDDGVINGQRNEHLLFHSSWDWLIPVIEKCRERQLFGSQRLIDNINKRLAKLDILATHANVCDFIKWYNLNE